MNNLQYYTVRNSKVTVYAVGILLIAVISFFMGVLSSNQDNPKETQTPTPKIVQQIKIEPENRPIPPEPYVKVRIITTGLQNNNRTTHVAYTIVEDMDGSRYRVDGAFGEIGEVVDIRKSELNRKIHFIRKAKDLDKP